MLRGYTCSAPTQLSISPTMNLAHTGKNIPTCIDISDIATTLHPTLDGQLHLRLLMNGKACSQETLNATTGFQLRPLKTLIRFYQRSQLTVELVHQKKWWKAAPSTVEAISFDAAVEKIRAAHSDPNRVLRERLGVTLVIKLLNDRLELSFTATINPINSTPL
ncbi:hypothetical protein C8J57DRAFT_1347391, partial [Mycena rebaudengoi]